MNRKIIDLILIAGVAAFAPKDGIYVSPQKKETEPADRELTESEKFRICKAKEKRERKAKLKARQKGENRGGVKS